MSWTRLLPPLPAREPHEQGRVATPLELVFDLVSVVAIGSATAGLHHAIVAGHGLEVLPRFLFLFASIWWAWMNFTWFASAFGREDTVYKLLVMVMMVGASMFAGTMGHIMETMEAGVGILGWCLMRLAMAALWLRASHNPPWRRTCRRYALGIVMAQVYWVLLFFLAPSPQVFLIGGVFGLILELLVPVVAERATLTPFHRHHISERYGLLTIISMGEIFISIALGFGALTKPEASNEPALIALAGAVIVFACYWLYFERENHLSASNRRDAFLWGYLHVAIFCALAVLAAGIAAQVDLAGNHQPADHGLGDHEAQAHGGLEHEALAHGLADAGGQWAGVSLAVFLLTLWVIRDRTLRIGWRKWVLPGMGLLALLGGVFPLPMWGVALIAVTAAVLRSWGEAKAEAAGAHH